LNIEEEQWLNLFYVFMKLLIFFMQFVWCNWVRISFCFSWKIWWIRDCSQL